MVNKIILNTRTIVMYEYDYFPTHKHRFDLIDTLLKKNAINTYEFPLINDIILKVDKSIDNKKRFDIDTLFTMYDIYVVTSAMNEYPETNEKRWVLMGGSHVYSKYFNIDEPFDPKKMSIGAGSVLTITYKDFSHPNYIDYITYNGKQVNFTEIENTFELFNLCYFDGFTLNQVK